MLTLIINEGGQPENRWIVDKKAPEDTQIIGPALKDAQGNYERGDWVDIIDGAGQVNQFRKDEIQAAELAANEAEAERLAKPEVKEAAKEPEAVKVLKGAKARLRDTKIEDAKSFEDLKRCMVDMKEVLING